MPALCAAGWARKAPHAGAAGSGAAAGAAAAQPGSRARGSPELCAARRGPAAAAALPHAPQPLGRPQPSVCQLLDGAAAGPAKVGCGWGGGWKQGLAAALAQPFSSRPAAPAQPPQPAAACPPAPVAPPQLAGAGQPVPAPGGVCRAGAAGRGRGHWRRRDATPNLTVPHRGVWRVWRMLLRCRGLLQGPACCSERCAAATRTCPLWLPCVRPECRAIRASRG